MRNENATKQNQEQPVSIMSSQERSAGQDKRLQWWNDVVYNTLAPLYNSLDWLTCGMWWALQSRALDHVERKRCGRVLEVGFGPGRLFVEIARLQPDSLDGIDLAQGMCRFTKERMQRNGLECTIVRGSVHDMPYQDSAFNTLVSTFSFSGFRDGKEAMKEMVRVLAPGGRVVIVDIGLPLDHNRVGTFWARLWEWCGDFLYDIPKLMEESGLTVSTFEEFGPGKHIRVVVGEKA
eukprot:CAMPEP_0202490496 /NCGR_PEP_ID=MMETSP1361-20130828/7887_1 /ASSEMBLY_ACC=CAM_ASM_000849 /TAXON_ID=210615 /ORGANISM="Staurosira complex sp., Strain CCMP2646" /LENGTH=234 /DNA_ID=CAMNT_0049120395 /DNA_START=214 /DNA_END=918 /DNA_ORIENTATION=-